MTSNKKGKLLVTYADGSVYRYTIFQGKLHSKLVLKQYLQTGYYAALQPNGKKLVLMNVLTGGHATSVRTIPTAIYTHHAIQFVDVRSKAQPDIVITSKRNNQVWLYVAELNIAQAKFKYNAVVKLQLNGVNINKTNVLGNTIDLRSNVAPLASYLVTTAYKLVRI